MKCHEIEKALIKNMDEMEIIDAHEHLPPEAERLKSAVDFFTFFSHYTHFDLLCAGMSEEEYQGLLKYDTPLEPRWKTFAPYWEKIRYTSYSKSVLLSVKKLYGIDDINEKTYLKISEAIKESNKPGLYDRILGKTCRIKTALDQWWGHPDVLDLGTPLLTPIAATPKLIGKRIGEVKSIDGCSDLIREIIVEQRGKGAVGLKIGSKPYVEPNVGLAKSELGKLLNSELKLYACPNLINYVMDLMVAIAGEENMVVAVHTGYWGDFRQVDPLHMIPVVMRHPKTKFDIYHLGFPWLRETLMMGKGFPNVWLNLCWTHVISQRCTISAMDEALDLIPTNKILAFGGDYMVVEKVYGHLVMAKEDIARVFAKRIKENDMSEKQAMDIIKQWLWDNPKELYGLKI